MSCSRTQGSERGASAIMLGLTSHMGLLIRNASANSLESDLRCTPRVYFDIVTSQKPCQYNNKFDCSKTNGYNIPQDVINEVYVFSIKYRYSDILL